jgi:threonine aldolase
VIDLRSDTVTLPSPAMREAMAKAELGDDYFGEDPTVNRFQALAAELVGKEAALLVASGTMGNLVSLLSHCDRGTSVVLGDESHILHYESGGAAVLGGVMYRAVPTNADGTLPLDAVRRAILPRGALHHAATAVLAVENTHNRCGGTVLAPEYLGRLAGLARQHRVAMHLDGARIFNAAVASGAPVTAWTAHVDSVQVCLSKGLAAPVGSFVAGSSAFVERARAMRKLVGGAMRQAGIIAAAGIVALTEMVDRLREDHENASRLAHGLRALPGIALDLASVQTNIVVFTLLEGLDPAEFTRQLAAEDVLVIDMGGGRLRAVTHYGIAPADCDRAIAVCRRVLEEMGGERVARARATFEATEGRR